MKIEKRRGNKNKKNENEVDVKRSATNDNNNKTMKNDYYSKSLYRN